MAKGKYKSSINSSRAVSLLGSNNKVGVATSLWGIFSEFTIPNEDSDSLHTQDQLNIASLHSSFVPVFTNISKKDCLTRLKGLIGFKEELSLYQLNKNSDIDWEPVLSNFTYIYIRVGVYDSDVKIRKLSNECLLLLYHIVGGKKLQKYCKLFFPALWLSCNDPKPDVSKSAMDCLEGFVGGNNKERIIKIINYCNSLIFDLYGRLLSCNVKNIKNELNANVSSLSEEEELFDRLISTCLASVRKTIEILYDETSKYSFCIASHIIFSLFPKHFNQFLEPEDESFSWNTLQMGSIWKFISNSYSSVIRVEAIQVLSFSMNIVFQKLQNNSISELSLTNYVPSLSRLFVDILNCMNDTCNSNVQAVSSKLLLIFLKLFSDIWQLEPNKLFDSPIKYFEKVLFSCLNRQNQLSCDSLYSELPQIIASIPFKIILKEFLDHKEYGESEIGEKFNELIGILDREEFYFQSFNQLLLFLHINGLSNKLPFICLLPFNIISPMIKFNSSEEVQSFDSEQDLVVFGIPNLNLFQNSINTYYIILFLLLNRVNSIKDHQELKDILIKYYSKVIWSPIVICLTLRNLRNRQNSLNCSKAQDKINEKLYDVILNSNFCHNWAIEQCKIYDLELCISNLGYFLEGYWDQYYINNCMKTSTSQNGSQVHYFRVYLEICSVFLQHNSGFLNKMINLCVNSIKDIFLKFQSSNNYFLDNIEYENIVFKSKLIKRALDEVVIKHIDSLSQKQIEDVFNQFINTYEVFTEVCSGLSFNKDIKDIYLICLFLDSFFISFISKFINSEFYKELLLKQLVSISKRNFHGFVLIFSFLKYLIPSKSLFWDSIIPVLCKELPIIGSDLINCVSMILKSLKEYEFLNKKKKKDKANDLLTYKLNKIDIHESVTGFLFDLCEASLQDSHLNSKFFESFILMQFKSISAIKSSMIPNSTLKEMNQIKDLLIISIEKRRNLSFQILNDLLNMIFYSINDLCFEQDHIQKIIIPIIDVIFINCKQQINHRFEEEIIKFENILLRNIFGIGSEINGFDVSIHKLIILLDRNSHFYQLNEFNFKNLNGDLRELFNKLLILLTRLTNLIAHQNIEINNDSSQIGFKIRNFLKIYSEVDFDIKYKIIKKKEVLNTKINSSFILFIIRKLFVSEEFTKIMLSSKNFVFEQEYIFKNLKIIQDNEENKFFSFLIKQFSQVLISEKIIGELNFCKMMENIDATMKHKITCKYISKLKKKLESDFLIYIYELICDENIKYRFLKDMMAYLDNWLLLKNNSFILFNAVNNRNLSNSYTNENSLQLAKKVVDKFCNEILFDSIKTQDCLKISNIVVMLLELSEEEKDIYLLKKEIYIKIDKVMNSIENLTDELNSYNFNLEMDLDNLFLICELLSNLTLIVGKYFDDNILENEIKDDLESKFQCNEIELSKFLIKLSSSIHYSIGKILGLSINLFNKYSINSDFVFIENINEYAIAIQEFIIQSMDLSSKIYNKLTIREENDFIRDEFRFTSITIPMETNTLSMFDKLLGLISTMLNAAEHKLIIDQLPVLLEQITRIKRSEFIGNKWILSIFKSKIGAIKENATEISRLLTTYSLKMHSSVLLILKEHNWHNVQYEYTDIKSATFKIEKLHNCIKNFLISKNKDDFDSQNYDNQDYDNESLRNYHLSFTENYDNNQSNNREIDHFEQGIQVLASHWRRLIGPSFSHQLLETYLSTIFLTLKDGSTIINDHKILADISQRLGCWCFILPKLISEDFIISTDSQNTNIKTIEKNLTPCIESLLELNPIVIGEAIEEGRIDIKSSTPNDFIPSPINDDDISICQALLYVIKDDSTNKSVNEMILKNTTFNNLSEIKKIVNMDHIKSKFINLPLINVLIKLAFQALIIIEGSSIDDDFTLDMNATESRDFQTNWVDVFKRSSNNERRNLLTGNLEDILLTNVDPEKNLWNSSNPTFIWLLATRIVLSLSIYFPRILREIWLCNSNNIIPKTLQKLVLNYFSPIIIPIEVNHIPLIVQKLSSPDKVITYDYNYSSRTIKINYSERGLNATLTFTFSQSHPLIIPKINIPNIIGISKKQNSNWVIAVIKAIRYKNITHAILTWINNLSLYLDGIEDCLICYSIVHPQYRSLPRKRCLTCKNIFHNECIYKWFKTSNKTTCPLCISIM